MCHVTYGKQHAIDCEQCEDSTSKIDMFTRLIKFNAVLDDSQVKKLLEIDYKCPFHQTCIKKPK
jgi:putative redox protein